MGCSPPFSSLSSYKDTSHVALRTHPTSVRPNLNHIYNYLISRQDHILRYGKLSFQLFFFEAQCNPFNLCYFGWIGLTFGSRDGPVAEASSVRASLSCQAAQFRSMCIYESEWIKHSGDCAGLFSLALFILSIEWKPGTRKPRLTPSSTLAMNGYLCMQEGGADISQGSHRTGLMRERERFNTTISVYRSIVRNWLMQLWRLSSHKSGVNKLETQ